MKAFELKDYNMSQLRGYIYAEQNLVYELSYEFWDNCRRFDVIDSINKTIHEYNVLEASLDNEEFNIQLSRITKLTEDRYGCFTDIDDGPFDLETEDNETVKLIIKAQLKIIYYCEELIQ